MPFVFRTCEFCARAGIEPSSASRALRAAVAQGAVSRIGRGLWQRRDIEGPAVECHAPHPFPPAWMNANECLLDAVFGAVPRRISHMMALEAAGVPLVIGPQLSFPRESARTAMPLGITVFREPSERVPLFATRLTERTWMSSPARAAIETAQHDMTAPRWDERIAWVFAEDGGSLLDPEEAVEISDALQMRAGLRRLSSIADALRRLAASDPSDALSRVPDQWTDIVRARRGDAWIRLRRSGRRPLEPSDAAWVDSERKVLWGQHPEALAASLMT
ncbi:hypothetical protein [Candidatus Poriferisodalis sp.]|uniref:hypothetical protein n=1 Tax=Candidatus Poriferisodalis sp. TaxID=3101277 RepID=UPI003B020F99